MLASFTLIFSLAAIHVLAVMSPGPDFVISVRNSLMYSRRAGVLTALGFASGCLVHISYSLLGLAYLINQSVMLFNVIKILGALYLMYIGVKALMSKGAKVDLETKKATNKISDFKAWQVGFITNILNPKATLYFLSVFSLAIESTTPAWVLITLSVVIFLVTFVWFSLVAICMTTPRVRALFLKFSKGIDQALGGILILLGIKLLLTTK